MRFESTLAAVLLLVLAATTVGPAVAVETSPTEAEVETLIEKLGSESYATRIRAKERLQRMGLEAFDELHVAQYHPDNEIAMTARFLVNSLLVSWSKESDPPEVHQALHEYGAQSEMERSSRIELLADLPDRKGLVALARLVRFESSLRLSRQAALAAMQQPIQGDLEARKRSAERIVETLRDSDRHAASWLRVYAEDLIAGTYSRDRWQQLLQDERDAIDTGATQQSTRESVLELVRVCATRASELGRDDVALELATDNIDLISPTTRHLIDSCHWATDKQLQPFVLELYQRHRRIFDANPVLLYSAANAELARNAEDEAEKLALQASAIRPIVMDPDRKSDRQPRDVEEAAEAHREIANELYGGGMFEWAEREYRQVIDVLGVDSQASANTRRDFARMLAELQRHGDVVDTLQPLVDRVENDGKLRQRLNQVSYAYDPSLSDLKFHKALDLIEQGNLDQARPLLAQAYEIYDKNIDILIAMYRTDGDDVWDQLVSRKLSKAISKAESSVRQTQLSLKNGGASPADLASAYNQFAWLVSNTEGDYSKALQYSLESLGLETDRARMGEKMDTCARCYFALGKLDQAVNMQREALQKLPHSPALQRQLAEFEAAQAKASSSDESTRQPAEES